MAIAGLALAISVSGCALLPEERGKAPLGANLERLAAIEPGNRERQRMHATPIELDAQASARRSAGAGS